MKLAIHTETIDHGNGVKLTIGWKKTGPGIGIKGDWATRYFIDLSDEDEAVTVARKLQTLAAGIERHGKME